jgi:pimeloyl-ACP methyl ester carboxylesterase
VADLKTLLNQLKLPAPYNLVGLSYGGGIAIEYATAFPKNVKSLILMAPYTESLAASDQWISYQVWLARTANPMNPATDDQLYDFFLHQYIYATYPGTEPIVLENPFKLEGIFRLVQGIRKLKAANIASLLPAATVNLISAGNDQYIPRQVLFDFWNAVPKGSRRSTSVILGSEHKIPEAVPRFSAAYTAEIVRGNPVFVGGRSFVADPKTGLVKYSGGQFQLPKEH